MGLKTHVEVAQADDAVGDGKEDEKDGNDGEGSEGPADSTVMVPPFGLVNANELKDEVAQGAVIKDEYNDHANLVLFAREPTRGDKNENGDWDSGDSKREFGILLVRDNNDELDDETEEEEKVKLEKGDVDLISQVSTEKLEVVMELAYLIVKETLLHPIIGTNNFEDIPSKLLIQLPGEEAHADSSKGNDDRNSNEVRANIGENSNSKMSSLQSILILQNIQGRENLIDLDGCVYHKGEVGEAHANNLDSVLHAKSIPDNHELVKKAENEQGKESWNSLELSVDGRVRDNIRAHAILESTKNISAGSQHHAPKK